MPQIPPAHILHHHKRRIFRHAKIKRLHDVRMLQRHLDLRLPPKLLHELRIRRNLQRPPNPQRLVQRQPNLPEPPLPQLPLQHVRPDDIRFLQNHQAPPVRTTPSTTRIKQTPRRLSPPTTFTHTTHPVCPPPHPPVHAKIPPRQSTTPSPSPGTPGEDRVRA